MVAPAYVYSTALYLHTEVEIKREVRNLLNILNKKYSITPVTTAFGEYFELKVDGEHFR